MKHVRIENRELRILELFLLFLSCNRDLSDRLFSAPTLHIFDCVNKGLALVRLCFFHSIKASVVTESVLSDMHVVSFICSNEIDNLSLHVWKSVVSIFF